MSSTRNSIDPDPAVLFADISGWGELCSRLGDEPAKKIVDPLLAELGRIVEGRNGWVVKRIGDELMCVFDAPGDAALAACEMQRYAEVRNRSAIEKLFLRIGFHCGPVLRDNDDLHGDTVNTAARIVSEAFRERILASRAAADRFPEKIARRVRPWRNASLKGKEAEIALVELIWRQETSSGTVAVPAIGSKGPKFRRATLRHRGTQLVLEPGGKPIKFGRGEANDLVIHDPSAFVSSSHGQIEFRGGAVEVVDTSRNGIYVAFGDGEFFLVNKRLGLRASGRMTLGRAPQDDEAIVLEFKLE